MPLFNWNNQPQPKPEQNPQDIQQPQPEVKEEDFIDTSDPNSFPLPSEQPKPVSDPQPRNVIVHYSIGMPIDGVYIYMEHNWEDEGLADAAKTPDIAYMLSKIEIIKQGLQRRFDLTKLNYNKLIRDCNAKIKTLSETGMLGTLSRLEAYIDTCNEHLQKISELEQKFQNQDPSLMSMIDSYKRGFALGIASQTTDFISNNDNQ